ncbi:MAG: hypothetical protein AAF628_20345 [Planctomycetota bacterium]
MSNSTRSKHGLPKADELALIDRLHTGVDSAEQEFVARYDDELRTFALGVQADGDLRGLYEREVFGNPRAFFQRVERGESDIADHCKELIRRQAGNEVGRPRRQRSAEASGLGGRGPSRTDLGLATSSQLIEWGHNVVREALPLEAAGGRRGAPVQLRLVVLLAERFERGIQLRHPRSNLAVAAAECGVEVGVGLEQLLQFFERAGPWWPQEEDLMLGGRSPTLGGAWGAARRLILKSETPPQLRDLANLLGITECVRARWTYLGRRAVRDASGLSAETLRTLFRWSMLRRRERPR